MIDTELDGKVVLVTGANHGIGAATARAFGAQGAKVFLQYLSFPVPNEMDGEDGSEPGGALYHRNKAATADSVVSAIRDGGGQAESFEGDLANPAIVPEIFDRVEAAFGGVDVLVNNAAHGELDTFVPGASDVTNQLLELRTDDVVQTLTAEGHDRHFAVNSRAVALMMAEYARRHVGRGARRGRIINVSTDGAPGFPGEVSYGASKYALESYSRSAASELGQYGITVNIVSPGPIQTGYITPELEERVVAGIPMGRLGKPEDVADAIVFLASEQARWITGQLLSVGGGNSMA